MTKTYWKDLVDFERLFGKVSLSKIVNKAIQVEYYNEKRYDSIVLSPTESRLVADVEN